MAEGDCLFCQFKMVVLHIISFEAALLVLVSVLTLRCQNFSYITDHIHSLKNLSVSSFRLVGGKGLMLESCKPLPSTYPKDAQSLVKVTQRDIGRWTSVVPYVISQP